MSAPRSGSEQSYEEMVMAICEAMAARADGDLLASPPEHLPPELRALVTLWTHTLEARAVDSDRIHDMALPMLLLDRDTLAIKSTNRAALRLFRYDNAGELVYEDIKRLVPDRANVTSLTPQQDLREAQGQRKDGKIFDVELEWVGEDPNGDLMIAARDISERRAYEQAMQEARDTALRTAELQGHFLANMSHEIRTPVNGILGMSELLRDSALDRDQQQHVEAIRASGNTLLVLINDILDLSKIESGQMSLDLQPTDLHSIVDEVFTLVGPRADEQGNRLVVDYPQDVPRRFLTDGLRVKQLLINLVGNAVKFTHNGHVTLRAALLSRDGDQCAIRLDVEDTGIGIPEEKLEKIFDKFTQAESSTTRRFGGTGLGLAICRQVTALLDGTLKVESIQGEGSTFSIFLPLTALPDVEAGADGAAAAEIKRRDLTGLQVLVAEDNPINQTITRRTLEKMGCQVKVVENGAEADEAAAAQTYDLVLMDCMMPDTDGFEGSRRIRAREAGGGIRVPIIALTAKAMKGDRDACIAAGMDDYLTKPFTPAALRTMVETWCFPAADDASSKAS